MLHPFFSSYLHKLYPFSSSYLPKSDLEPNLPSLLSNSTYQMKKFLPLDRGAKGFTLIEVLLAMMVFGILSAGILSLFAFSSHSKQTAYVDTLAAEMVKSVAENVLTYPSSEISHLLGSSFLSPTTFSTTNGNLSRLYPEISKIPKFDVRSGLGTGSFYCLSVGKDSKGIPYGLYPFVLNVTITPTYFLNRRVYNVVVEMEWDRLAGKGALRNLGSLSPKDTCRWIRIQFTRY